MALALDDEAVGRFTVEDFVDFGRKFGLEAKAVRDMIEIVRTAVIRHASTLLRDVLSPHVIETILGRAASLSDGAG